MKRFSPELPELIPLSFGTPSAQINANPFTIGRGKEMNLIIHSNYISRKHLTIMKKGEGPKTKYMIICHSHNNLYLNNIEIKDNRWR